jgi:hypothetical protein
VFLLDLGFIIYSRGENEETLCQNCVNTRFIEEIEGLQVSVLSNNWDEKTFIGNQNKAYEVCNRDIFKSVEYSQIILVDGSISERCDSLNADLINLDKVKVIDYCYDPIPASNENFYLFNYWTIFSVQTTDTILYKPCKARYIPNLTFPQEVYEEDNNELSYRFSKSSGNNDYGGSYIIKGDSLLLKLKFFTFGYYASAEAVYT